jgi:tetratricopeptide (TPR) repeat protein
MTNLNCQSTTVELLNIKNEAQVSELLFFFRKYESFDSMLSICYQLNKIDKEKSSFQLSGLGYALNMLERYREAIGYFIRARENSSSRFLIEINLGMSYYGLRDLQNSIQYFEDANKSIAAKPKEDNFKTFRRKITEFSSERTWIALLLGNSKSAIRHLEAFSISDNIT